jgi:hypothetical protein
MERGKSARTVEGGNHVKKKKRGGEGGSRSERERGEREMSGGEEER